MAIVSSSDEPFVRAVADYLGVTSYIDFFVTQNQVKNLKPAPDIYRYALAQAGVSADCAVGVEDSEPGTLALHRAEMFTVGFLNEGKNHQVLEQTDSTDSADGSAAAVAGAVGEGLSAQSSDCKTGLAAGSFFA